MQRGAPEAACRGSPCGRVHFSTSAVSLLAADPCQTTYADGECSSWHQTFIGALPSVCGSGRQTVRISGLFLPVVLLPVFLCMCFRGSCKSILDAALGPRPPFICGSVRSCGASTTALWLWRTVGVLSHVHLHCADLPLCRDAPGSCELLSRPLKWGLDCFAALVRGHATAPYGLPARRWEGAAVRVATAALPLRHYPLPLLPQGLCLGHRILPHALDPAHLLQRGTVPNEHGAGMHQKGPQRRPQRRLDRRWEEVAKAVGGLSGTNAIEPGTWRQGDSGWA